MNQLAEETIKQTQPSEKKRFDYILVGGGLQSGLIALALQHYRPEATVAIVERSDRLAGNHTWSFHESDVTPKLAAWISSLVEHRWPSYEVSVGNYRRRIDLGYRTISSQFFAEQVSRQFAESKHGSEIFLDCKAAAVENDHVVLSDGCRLFADCVIDSRGPAHESCGSNDHSKFVGGFQKFWGFELELPIDWPLATPVIMDDQVDQADGFRFFYTLPFEARRVLIEDTRFSDSPSLERGDCFHQVDGYLRRLTKGQIGIEHCRILREEHGVLPMPAAGFYPDSDRTVIAGGYRGNWFHAATGYSFPIALRFADLIATTPVPLLREKLTEESKRQMPRAMFARFLNRLLFQLVRPNRRYQIFRRFYKVLPESRIARFYAHQFNAIDAARIVIGLPPGGLRPVRFLMSFLPQSHLASQTQLAPQSQSIHSSYVPIEPRPGFAGSSVSLSSSQRVEEVKS
jgi:lycopene beta-cyclase